MDIPLTAQLLGDLIENGFGYMLSNTAINLLDGDIIPIKLKPVKNKPVLSDLPPGYETFYKITREPLQLACGVDKTLVMVEYDTQNNYISNKQILDDSYFRMSEEFFHQVLNSLEDYAIFTINQNAEVNSWNSGAENILGYTEPEVLGLNVKIFFTPEDIQNHIPEKEQEGALENGRAVDERYHVRKDGTRFWASGLIFPLFDEEHKHRGFTKIMRNLEERKEAQKEAGL